MNNGDIGVHSSLQGVSVGMSWSVCVSVGMSVSVDGNTGLIFSVDVGVGVGVI